MELVITIAILFVIALLIAVSCIKIVPQAHASVVECLGAYRVTWGVGIHFKRPFVDRVARMVQQVVQVVHVVELQFQFALFCPVLDGHLPAQPGGEVLLHRLDVYLVGVVGVLGGQQLRGQEGEVFGPGLRLFIVSSASQSGV